MFIGVTAVTFLPNRDKQHSPDFDNDVQTWPAKVPHLHVISILAISSFFNHA